MWPTKVKFDWPLAKIGLKMANGQLLFCALIIATFSTSMGTGELECILSYFAAANISSNRFEKCLKMQLYGCLVTVAFKNLFM